MQKILLISAGSPQSQAVFWGLILVVAIVVLGTGIWFVRRRLFGASTPDGEETWSLQHLRDLKASGQITGEEFETLKAGMLKSARRVIEKSDKISH